MIFSMEFNYFAAICFCILNQETSLNMTSYNEDNMSYLKQCAKIIINYSENNTAILLECVINSYKHVNNQSTVKLNNQTDDAFLEDNLFDMEPKLANISLAVEPVYNVSFNMILLIALYVLTIVVSVTGNIFLIIVMSCGFHSSFLDISAFLVNMGIFNLLMSLFCMPFTFVNALLKKWIFTPFMCPLTNFIQLLSVNGCILTLIFLAVNRFNAVSNPITHRAKNSKNKIRKNIAAIWILAVCLSVVQLFIYTCQKPELSMEHAAEADFCYCHEKWTSNEKNSTHYYSAYTIWIFLQTYLVPAVIIIIMYTKIMIRLLKRNNGLVTEQSSTSRRNSASMKTQTIKANIFCHKFNT